MTKEFEEIVTAKALEAGFMISTQYGQEELKLMPRSDMNTLREFARAVAFLVVTASLPEIRPEQDAYQNPYLDNQGWNVCRAQTLENANRLANKPTTNI